MSQQRCNILSHYNQNIQHRMGCHIFQLSQYNQTLRHSNNCICILLEVPHVGRYNSLQRIRNQLPHSRIQEYSLAKKIIKQKIKIPYESHFLLKKKFNFISMKQK